MRLGLAQEGELWILTHAVYGLRKSPKLWSDFKDAQLLGLRFTLRGVEYKLLRGKLDPNWWRVVNTTSGEVVGGLLTYVDDFLLGGTREVVEALAQAIQCIWQTTPFTLATPEPLRFLKVEILVEGLGFVTALGRIPCPRELAWFDVQQSS